MCRWGSAAFVVVIALWLGGCGDEGVQEIDRWELRAPSLDEPRAITLPAHLDSVLPREDGELTLHAEVPLERFRGQALTLASISSPGLATLRVNGVPVTPIDAPPPEGYRDGGPRRWHIPRSMTGGESLVLDLTVRARWTQALWLDNPPRLSATPRGDPWFLFASRVNHAGAVFGLSTILLISFFYWVLFFTTPRRREAQFWFALESLCGAAYPAFVLGLTQWPLGGYDGAVMGIALSVAALANVHFAHAHLGLPRPSPLVAAGALASALIYALVARDPWRMTLYGAPTTVVVMLAVAIYQSVLLVRMLRAGRRALHEWIVPFSWPFAHLWAATDFAAWLGLGEISGGLRLGCIGIGSIALTQAIALSREYLQSLARADELNHELAARVALLEEKQRENERLTAELRRQVAERSAQLFAALASVDDAEVEMPRTGEVIDGEYEIVRLLGRGGMARVFEARRRSNGEPVALKVSRERRAEALARMAREAQIAATVTHPHIVSLLDVRVSSRGFLYLAMERVEGKTLRDHLRERPAIEWCLRALIQVCEGLGALHRAGVVHRDLKPENILVASEGTLPVVKLVDFGISRWADDPRARVAGEDHDTETTVQLGRDQDGAGSASPQLTGAGLIAGTPSYAAPEGWGDARLTAQSDLFGLGVIAFEMFAGRRPWAVPPLIERMQGHAITPPLSLAERCPALPPRVIEVLHRCFAISPRERPSLDEVCDALTEALAAPLPSPPRSVAPPSRAISERAPPA